MTGKIFTSLSTFFLDFVETLVIGLSIFLVIYLFFMQPHQVSGHSMETTLMDKDYVLTDKVSYKVGDPQRGDIVVFHAPPDANCPVGTGCDFIKRIIALPGEEVSVRSNGIYINGVKLDEPYLDEGIQTEAGNFTRGRSITVGQDEYFMVGDNRPHSSDSRAWGPVNKSQIVGKAFFRYWPMEDMHLIQHQQYAAQ